MSKSLSDSALVAKLNGVDDHEIVALLKNGDYEAWHYIELKAIFPIMKSARLGRMAYDRGLSSDEIGNMVYEMLLAKKKIDLFEYRCPFVFWVRNWVAKAILGYCEKNDNPVSQEVVEAVLKDKEAKVYDREGFEVANKCFARLWKENRLRASVHYLKVISELTSKEIMRLLHLSSEANVNQIFSRALKDMRQYREELDAVNWDRVGKVTTRKEVVNDLS